MAKWIQKNLIYHKCSLSAVEPYLVTTPLLWTMTFFFWAPDKSKKMILFISGVPINGLQGRGIDDEFYLTTLKEYGNQMKHSWLFCYGNTKNLSLCKPWAYETCIRVLEWRINGRRGGRGWGLKLQHFQKNEFISTQTRGGLIPRCIFFCLQVDGPILGGGDSLPCRRSQGFVMHSCPTNICWKEKPLPLFGCLLLFKETNQHWLIVMHEATNMLWRKGNRHVCFTSGVIFTITKITKSKYPSMSSFNS